MYTARGLALLIPGIILFVGFTLLNTFMDGVLRIVFLLVPTVAILIGVTLLCPGDKKIKI